MTSSKWHALGNSYLVVEGGALDPERVRARCAEADTDGIVEILDRRGAEANALIWNPDGSTAEFSGNGARIAAAWLSELVGETDVVLHFGEREAAAYVDGSLVALDAGGVEVGQPEELDLGDERLTFTPVSVGNPHAVVRREGGIAELGPRVENHPRFPERTNVQFVRVDGPHDLEIAIWERGAGETTASGTSSVAAAAAAIANGWCESPVTVAQPGGVLLVAIENGRARLTGPVEKL